MDIIRQQKKTDWQRFKAPGLILIIVLFALILSKVIASSDYVVERSKLLIAQVEHGAFVIKVRGPGVLTPKDIRWIASEVDGRAERVLVKPGAEVKAGDVLIELANPQLKRQLDETRWELEAQEAEAVAAKVSLASLLLDQQARVLNAKLDFESVAMRLKAETELFEKGAQAVSKLDYEKTKLASTQTQQKLSIEQQRLDKMEENVSAQSLAQDARLKKMRKTLERMEKQVENLVVRASIDSVVQDVAIEAGQQVPIGASVAKLAKQKELIAELQIPELAIRDVAIGQTVMIDTRNNEIQGKVIRIAPRVNEGAVQVDVALVEPLPNDARPDLSVDGEILVANLDDTLFIRRPSFAQSNRTLSLFKLTQNEQQATRVSVALGQGSVRNIQIINGLKAGDKVIISQNDELNRFDHISIN